MLKKLKALLIGLFEKNDDPTAYNCEVFIHKPTGELVVVNAKGELELNQERFHLSDMDGIHTDGENKIVITLDRRKLEYLGTL